jgi:hypothetical protein
MKLFGTYWGSDLFPRVAVPVGETCLFCEEPIAEDATGVLLPYDDADGSTYETPAHRQCFVDALAPRTRDRARLLRGQKVAADPNATLDELADAFHELQSTDDPDPVFLQVHDQLRDRYYALKRALDAAAAGKES